MIGIKINDRDIIKDLNRKRKNFSPFIIMSIAVSLTVVVIICLWLLLKDNDTVHTISENASNIEQDVSQITPQDQPQRPLFEGLELLAIVDGVHIDTANLRVILDKDKVKSKNFFVKSDIVENSHEIGTGIDGKDIPVQISEFNGFELAFAEKSSLKLIFDRLYFTETVEDDYYYYVNFFDPRDKYDKILVLDPGHGGEDAGATIGEIYEKDIDIRIAKKIYDKFEADTECGIKAIMTRHDDTFLTLEDRVRIANDVSDIFVSIHSDTYEKDTGVSGIQTHYLPDYTALESELLAANIQKNVAELTGARDRGIDKVNRFYVINHTLTPSSLIETGYMTNPEELKRLLDDEYLEKIAEGIYRGIIESCEGITFRDKNFFDEAFYN